jgi:putrescine importer
VLFFAAAVRYLWHSADLTAGNLLLPFYDPETFSWRTVSLGTSTAVLTYIGFDAISTLSEEAHNPRRNILLATVLTCLLTGVLAAAEVYAAQLIWPGDSGFPDQDTAFVQVAQRAGGPALFFIMNLALLVANVGSGFGSQLAASRLLYGMGRDNAIPRRFFGVLDRHTQIPRNNVLLVGGLALALSLTAPYDLMTYERGADLLVFGAFIGFMGVNAAALVHYFVRAERKTFWNLAPPLLSFAICLAICASQRVVILGIGLAWLAIGLLYGAWKTKGFRQHVEFAALEEEKAAV